MRDNPQQHQRVQQQFGAAASRYVQSATHAHGGDMAILLQHARLDGTQAALDVATGGGHTALAFAPRVRHMVASDITLPMLQAARDHIRQQGDLPVTYCRNAAEALPFASAAFDVVLCRVAAHHFANIRAFVGEAARVLRPGGQLIVSDHIGLDDPDLDAFMDRFERWRDPAHVRSYRYAEWRDFCATAGLEIVHTEDFAWQPYDFAAWTARIGMPDHERDALEQWLLAAAPRYRDFFAIRSANGRVLSLRSTFAIMVAEKPR